MTHEQKADHKAKAEEQPGWKASEPATAATERKPVKKASPRAVMPVRIPL